MKTQPLVWVRNGKDSAVNTVYYRISACGKYTVAKYWINGAWRYEAWLQRGEKQGGCQRLGSFANDVKAKACCQRHLDGQDGRYVEQTLAGAA